MAVEYQRSESCGAVLISSSPVLREAFYYQAPFKKWVKENATALLHGQLAEDIKKHGLFVVTQTFATKKCALTAWRSPETKVHFGFGFGISGLAELSPEVEWYAGSSETGWNFHEAEQSEMKVVFAGGLWFSKVPVSKVSSISVSQLKLRWTSCSLRTIYVREDHPAEEPMILARR